MAQSTLEANRVSNWTVALMLGAAAALRSGSQSGIVGELPFCDLVLALDTKRIPNAESGENVFYGRDTLWARMILKSFKSRRLPFSYVLLGKRECPACSSHRCLMANDPMEEKRRKEKERKRAEEQRKRPEESDSVNATGNGHTQDTPAIASTIDSTIPIAGRTSDLAVASNDGSKGVTNTSSSNSNSPNSEHLESDEPATSESHSAVQITGKLRDPTGDDAMAIQPNMLYGLSKDYRDEDGHDYKVIHKRACIYEMTIDKRSIEFLSKQLYEKLKKKTYIYASNTCKDIIIAVCEKVRVQEGANIWDKRICDRVEKLMKEYPLLPEGESDNVWNETMDRIHSRLPDMFDRLDIKEFIVETSGTKESYSADDVSGAFLVYFGIQRALAMSDDIYDTRQPALVFQGYNVSTGHDVIRDLTEVPSQDVPGFTSRLVIESTAKMRVVEKKVEPSHIFRLAILLDTAISVAIMMLTFIGPVLSMYGARLWTSSYRETYMKMGTTMRWSVSKVSMMHSGTARDDWMVCIKPDRNWKWSTVGFVLLALVSSVTCIVLWPFFHPTLAFPLTEFSRIICIVSCVVGVPWVILAQTVFKQPDNGDGTAKEKEEARAKRTLGWLFNIRSVHSIINIGLVALIIIFAGINLEESWLYLYVLEGVYALQWLYGEMMDDWVYESTALFMLGALSALRLTNLPK